MSEWLHSIPIYWATIIGSILFIAVIITVWRFPREYILAGALDKAGWRDLRIWATVICLIQIGIYLVFR